MLRSLGHSYWNLSDITNSRNGLPLVLATGGGSIFVFLPLPDAVWILRL
jgi:hypothetical protein